MVSRPCIWARHFYSLLGFLKSMTVTRTNIDTDTYYHLCAHVCAPGQVESDPFHHDFSHGPGSGAGWGLACQNVGGVRKHHGRQQGTWNAVTSEVRKPRLLYSDDRKGRMSDVVEETQSAGRRNPSGRKGSDGGEELGCGGGVEMRETCSDRDSR